MNLDIFSSQAELWQSAFEREYLNDEPARIQEVSSGIVLPPKPRTQNRFAGGVATQDFSFVAGFLRLLDDPSTPPGYWGINESYTVKDEALEHIDDSVIFGGFLIDHFGHFLLESLSRLWFVLDNPDDVRPIAFISKGNSWPSWFDEFMQLLDIPQHRIIHVVRPTQFANVTVPEETIHSWRSCKRELRYVYDKLARNAGEGPYSKVYLTRSGVKDSFGHNFGVYGESYFEHFYAERGYEVVSPETLSIREQIALVHGASEIVSTMGTLAHFALVAKPSAHCTFLLRSPERVIPPQALIQKLIGIDTTLVDVGQNILHAHSTPISGFLLIGPTPSWCEYACTRFNSTIDPQISKELPDYIAAWIRYYRTTNGFARIADWTAFDFIEQMSRGLEGAGASPMLETQIRLRLPKEPDTDGDLFVRDMLLGAARTAEGLEHLAHILPEPWAHIAAAIAERPLLSGQIHIAVEGWLDYEPEGVWASPRTPRRIEAVRIRPSETTSVLPWELQYAVRDAQGKWSKNCRTGESAGTVGQKKPITGIRVSLDTTTTRYFTVKYRVGDFDGAWSDWGADGQPAGFADNRPLAAIELVTDFID